MFNNLIESSSHAEELKRRGTFFLLTTTTYVVLFAITGVVSIYAYDAHLETQNTQLEILAFVPLEPVRETAPEVVRNTIAAASNPGGGTAGHSRPAEVIDSTSNPINVPADVGTTGSDLPQANTIRWNQFPEGGPPTGAGFNNRGGSGGGTGSTPIVEMPDPPPAATPNPPPVRTINISRGVLNGRAISLPRPNYPPLAKQIRVQGTVTVQVLIDESGSVVSAKAVSGHPLLIAEAVEAARRARFSPTLLSDQPVKVSGVITYNFAMP